MCGIVFDVFEVFEVEVLREEVLSCGVCFWVFDYVLGVGEDVCAILEFIVCGGVE